MPVHSRIRIWKCWFFEERGKREYPEKNLSEQSREPTTNSAHIWRWIRESNPAHIGGRQALSPLLQPCCPKNSIIFFNTWYFCQSILYWKKREFLLDMENIFEAIYHTLRACKKSTCFFFCKNHSWLLKVLKNVSSWLKILSPVVTFIANVQQ